MAKPGQKQKSAQIHMLQGTSRNDRQVESVVDELTDEIVRPKWLTGRARKIWAEKIERYEKRNQNISGCEDSLAQYCCLEAALIDDFWRKKLTPPTSMLNSYRIFASEFYDTPSSQQVRKAPSGGKSGNSFGKNKRR